MVTINLKSPNGFGSMAAVFDGDATRRAGEGYCVEPPGMRSIAGRTQSRNHRSAMATSALALGTSVFQR